MEIIKSLYHLRSIKDQINPFYAKCLEHIAETNSQCFQDIWILYETEFKKNGYFVDFGATDGVDISNSYLLEKNYGWQGIVAEPNTKYHNALKANRKCHISHKCVFTESVRKILFVEAEASDLSTIIGFGKDDEHSQKRETGIKKEVDTISLVDLLKSYNAPKEIDYLSIDTEGSEFAILNSFFMNKPEYSFNYITVEHNYVTKMREQIHNLLTRNGYVRVFTDISLWDDYYKLEK